LPDYDDRPQKGQYQISAIHSALQRFSAHTALVSEPNSQASSTTTTTPHHLSREPQEHWLRPPQPCPTTAKSRSRTLAGTKSCPRKSRRRSAPSSSSTSGHTRMSRSETSAWRESLPLSHQPAPSLHVPLTSRSSSTCPPASSSSS